MTVVVGILNRQGLALAADSAATITTPSGSKILNNSNKLFSLSKYHPVAIMIYNSAFFMGVPWETLIKVYRDQLKEKSFPTVKQYQEDFIEFLRQKKFFATPDAEQQALLGFCYTIIYRIAGEVLNENPELFNPPSPEKNVELIRLFDVRVDEYRTQFQTGHSTLKEFDDYSFEQFLIAANESIDFAIAVTFEDRTELVSAALRHKLSQLLHVIFKIEEFGTDYTGLIFSGFGSDEIFPSLIPINISMAIDGRLRFFVEEPRIASITAMNSSAICPFGQVDVINTVLRGIDSELDDIYQKNFATTLSKYNEKILAAVGDDNPELAAQINALDITAISKEMIRINRDIKQVKHINPLTNAVATLAKEDLADMAESLVYLTYLKRRITSEEESVGGPVDVAVLSKGDGLIWIKRKHYFKPELNQHFFANYLKRH